MWISLLILTLAPLFAQQNSCLTDNALNTRSIYSIGDTLSIEDQNFLYPVCNGSDNYATGDLFSFSISIIALSIIDPISGCFACDLIFSHLAF